MADILYIPVEKRTASTIQSSSVIIEDTLIIPEPSTLIKINYIPNIGSIPLPLGDTSKDEVSFGTLELSCNGVQFNIPCSIYVQGNSSARAAVKNWNIKFHQRTEGATKEGTLWVKIGNAIPSSKLTYKSDLLDDSKSRNYLSYALFNQVVGFRKGYPKNITDIAWLNADNRVGEGYPTGATEAPRTWTAVFYNKGSFYSQGNLITTKDYYNYNVDKNNTGSPATYFRGNIPKNPLTLTEFVEDKQGQRGVEALAPKNEELWTEERLGYVNRLSSFLGSSDVDFVSGFDDHFHRENAIDYFLTAQFVKDHDGLMEILFITYDGAKWGLLPWDKDTTFGKGWSGPTYVTIHEGYDGTYLENNITGSASGNLKLFYRMRKSFKDEIRNRYTELKTLGVFSVENVMKLLQARESLLTPEIRIKDYELYKAESNNGYTIHPEVSAGEGLVIFISERLRRMDDFWGVN